MLGTEDVKERELVELIKAEVNIVYSQMHIRMNHKYAITTIGVAFAGAFVSFSDKVSILSHPSKWNSSQAIVLELIIILLYILCLLSIREDVILADHDRYIYILRHRVLIYFKAKGIAEPNYIILGFLPSMKNSKTQGLLGMLFSFLSYVPIFVPASSLHLYFIVKLRKLNFEKNICDSISNTFIDRYIQHYGFVFLSFISFLILCVFIYGIFIIKNKHDRNRLLSRKLSAQYGNSNCFTSFFLIHSMNKYRSIEDYINSIIGKPKISTNCSLFMISIVNITIFSVIICFADHHMCIY